jgi:hypothetical protein
MDQHVCLLFEVCVHNAHFKIILIHLSLPDLNILLLLTFYATFQCSFPGTDQQVQQAQSMIQEKTGDSVSEMLKLTVPKACQDCRLQSTLFVLSDKCSLFFYMKSVFLISLCFYFLGRRWVWSTKSWTEVS